MKIKHLKIFYSLITLFLVTSCGDCSSSSRRQRARENQAQKQENRRDRSSSNTPSVSPPTNKPLPPSPYDGTAKSTTDVVAYAENCVFMVYALDENDEPKAQGSGFFTSADGKAMSNHHVFEPGVNWLIKTLDGETYPVQKVISSSERYDYVIFQIDTKGKTTPYLELANQTPRKGEEVLVLGNPKGLESTLSRGVVAALREKGDLIQMDAAISPGSSGGPVMTLQGKVVGIATLKIQECENCNFAYNIKLAH